MTDFDKVRSYYAKFNEWDRLARPEGQIEYRLTCERLDKHLAEESRILDLGGGPGRYTVYLAGKGHRVTLADISPELLEIAKQKVTEHGVAEKVDDILTVNSTDLSAFDSDVFDAVLTFGPYYHLTESDERERATTELARVLKPSGLVFSTFISRINGLAGLVSRASANPAQVTSETFRDAVETGIFRNADSSGFQEGYYPEPSEVRSLFESNGFTTIDLRSQKGLGQTLSEAIHDIESRDTALADSIMNFIRDTSDQESAIDIGGQALYIGRND